MGRFAILSLGVLLIHGGNQAWEKEQGQQTYRSLFVQAAQLRSQGEFEQAFATLRQALNVSRGDRLQYCEGKCLIQMGALKWNMGDIAESERLFNQAAAAFKDVGDRRAQEYCAQFLEMIRLYNLGKRARKERLFHRSVEDFEAACLIGRELGFPELQLKCLRQQALSYLDLRKLELFLENSRRGLEISTRTNHRLEQGRCLNNIGVYYQQRNEYSRAVISLGNALAIIRTSGDRVAEAECLSNLGLIYRELGNSTRAHFFLSKALELDMTLGDAHSVSMDLDNIGSVLLRRGIDENNEQDLFQALKAFQNGLSIQDSADGDALISFTALNNIGIILNELKDYLGARHHFERALKVVEHNQFALERCHAVSNVATSHLAEQHVDDALVRYNLTYEISSKYGFDNVLIESCFGLGQCYELKQDVASALSFYRKAIETLESMRARMTSEPFMIGFARNKFGAYDKAIRLLADRYAGEPSAGGLAELFDLVERAKARAFLESVREARVGIAASDYSALEERQQAISTNISELSLKLANYTVGSEEELATRNELALEEEEYVRLLSEIRVTKRGHEESWRREIRSLGEVQSLLGSEETVLLEYFLGEQRSYLIVVSPASAKLYTLPARGKIETSLRGYLKLISDRSLDPGAGFAAAERIGRELIPLDYDESLKKAKTVIVIPDGVLYDLPFEALRIRNTGGSKYLVEDMAISYCPSASALAVLKGLAKPGRWKKDLLAIGGPNYERHETSDAGVLLNRRDMLPQAYQEEGIELSPLPFSRLEVHDIAGLFPRDASDILTGDEANETKIKRLPLKAYRIVHFACHGFLNEPNPFRSALVLSATDATEDDGFLQTREIYGLTMDADLVVLSACQSGKGLLEGSEGPMGLARAFFSAGARSVISSLWTINDKSTVKFMHEFYRSLAGGLSAGEALRYAKLTMLRSAWAHPFYWASFMLQGDASVAGSMN